MKEIKRKFFKEEIRKTFILYALVPIIILSFLFYNLLFLYSRRLVETHNKKHNKNISGAIEKEFSEYETVLSELEQWSQIRRIFNYKYDEAVIYERFYNIVNKHSIRSIFYVYDKKGEVIITNSKVVPQYSKSDDLFMWGIFKRMKDNPNKTAMMLNRAQLDVNTRTVYSIGKAVTDSEKNILGFIVFDILENELNKIIQGSTSHHTVITDKYSNNIVTTNNGLLDSIGKLKHISEDSNSYVLSNSILNGNINIHTVTPFNFIKNTYLIGGVFLIIVFSLLIVLMIFIARRVSVSKTKSIDELLLGIKSIQEGNLSATVNIKTNDEFEILGQYYNEMVVKLNELIEKNKEEAKRSVLSEIKELEAQFNPHFLFNTLETLKCMIKIDEKNSIKIIIAMSNLLRYSINNHYRKVRLSEDIRYIEDYLTIQKFRFGENFDYLIELEESTKACMIPKLIIQPIIENSVKYGFETKKYLSVSIKCKIDNEKLVVEIEDNGEGISDDRLAEVLKNIRSSENTTNNIGLYNVQKRINLIYGNDYGIRIFSKPKVGTKVVIELPVCRGDE